MKKILPLKTVMLTTLRKVQKILRNATVSENTFQSFNMEVYEKIFFSFFKWPGKTIDFTTFWFYIIISISKEI